MSTTDKRGSAAGRPTNQAIRRSVSRLSPFADSDHDESGLTLRQRRILETIQATVAQRGYPPTIREICDAVGLASPASGAYQLKVLTDRGFLRRDPNRPRALEVVAPETDADRNSLSPPAAPTDDSGVTVGPAKGGVPIPLVGRIAAGRPILAEERVEDTFLLPEQRVGQGQLFMLEVRGDSMIGAAICDGDFVVVRSQPTVENGEIVAALLDDEATIKRYKRSGDQVWLVPANDLYAPLDGNQAVILGKVVTVVRRL